MKKLISRALAGEFPYAPEKEWVTRHPAIQAQEIGRVMRWIDEGPESQDTMVRFLAIQAHEELCGRKVYHLEVVYDPIMLLIGYRAIVGRK